MSASATTNGYETAYGHMSAFARGIEPGARVRQGQIIGYVGSTGLSTGSHVHYEILVNGRFVDPTRIKLPRGRSLEGPLLASFEREREPFRRHDGRRRRRAAGSGRREGSRQARGRGQQQARRGFVGVAPLNCRNGRRRRLATYDGRPPERQTDDHGPFEHGLLTPPRRSAPLGR